jgi:hypothetical protein
VFVTYILVAWVLHKRPDFDIMTPLVGLTATSLILWCVQSLRRAGEDMPAQGGRHGTQDVPVQDGRHGTQDVPVQDGRRGTRDQWGGNPVLRLLESRVAVGLGAFSYSLYLIHGLIVVHVKSVMQHVSNLPVFYAGTIVLCLGLSIGAAYVLYLAFERPFLRMKDRAR